MTQDPYTTLGVARGATEDEVAKAYRRLAKVYHPDLNQGNPEAARKMSEINRAYGEIKSGRAAQEGAPQGQAGYDGYRGHGNGPGQADGGGSQDPYGFDLNDLFGFFARGPYGAQGQGRYGETRDSREPGAPEAPRPASFVSGLGRVLVGLSLANLFFMFFGRLFF